MKVFNIDWIETFEMLANWARLSTGVREHILQINEKRGFDVTSEEQRRAFQMGVNFGLLEFFADGRRVRVVPSKISAMKVLRGMNLHTVAEECTHPKLREYLAMILHTEERERLTLGDERITWQRTSHKVLNDLMSIHYPQSFLSAGSEQAQVDWLMARRTSPHERSGVVDAEPLPTLQIASDLALMVQTLLAQTGPIELVKLMKRCAWLPQRRFADALRAGLRNVLILAGLNRNGVPEVSVPSPIIDTLVRAQYKLPPPLEPEEIAHWPTSSEDLLTMLVFLSQPRQVKTGDYSFFSKAEKELQALLAPLPNWLEAGVTEEIQLERIGMLRELAAEHGLSAIQGATTKRTTLVLTETGREWLSKPTAEQRAQLALASHELMTCDEPPLHAIRLSWSLPDFTPFRYELIAAFQQLDEPRCWTSYCDYASKVNNPLFTGGRDGGPVTQNGRRHMDREELELAWREALAHILNTHLLPHRGVNMGRFEERYTIQLTQVGRYILGLEETLDLSEEDVQAAIIVQPDFEVIFLVPNPGLDAAIAPFAQRIGQGVGALFKLTRESVQTGARSGLDIDQLLAQLAEGSSMPVPSNVRTEVIRWAGAVLHLDWEPAEILRCPDEETAQRVLATCGSYLEKAGPTLLLLRDSKKRTTVNRACAKAGIFLTEPPAGAKRRVRKRRSRNDWDS